MKITILGPAHPYRGGLSSIMESMAREFQRRGNSVSILTFTLQYPKFLFPGKSQTINDSAPKDLTITRAVNTMNPINWIRVGLRIKRESPDFVLIKYWTPFMAPCFGTIARIARGNGHTKFICQIDNVEPHEHHIIDKPFNRYVLRAIDGYIYMSEQVNSELKVYSSAPAIFSPHPMFEHFGAKVTKEEAYEKLSLDPSFTYTMFFGLIRQYKGLDILFEAWAKLKAMGKTSGRRLLVAGEFYTSKEPYLRLMEELDIVDEVVLHPRFIADDEVKYYFSAAESVVLPYRTASQSGVTQIAYYYCLPMVVSAVGGLPEIVPQDIVGQLCEPTPEGIAKAVDVLWSGDNLSRYAHNIIEERKRFSWEEMCNKIVEVYNITKGYL